MSAAYSQSTDAPANGTPFISCKQVVKAFQVSGHEIVALRGIDFEMMRGEMVAIIGPSGAGKSTLLNLLGGLDQPTAGQLSVDGLNLLELRGRQLADYRLRRVGFIWQQVDRNLLAHRTSLHNVTLPMMLAGEPPRQRLRRAQELLAQVDMSEHAHQRPQTLSGGQQQRIAIAVALANQPHLLLADEPTGSIDRKNGLAFMNLLADLRARFGLTILMVTHDLEIAGFADRVLTLRDGALGQELSEDEAGPSLDEAGRIQLPDPVQAHLRSAARIAVEVRPEGVLLRPEQAEDDDAGALLGEMLPGEQSAKRRRGLRQLFRRRQPKDAKSQERAS